jgi:hypothetical protein
VGVHVEQARQQRAVAKVYPAGIWRQRLRIDGFDQPVGHHQGNRAGHAALPGIEHAVRGDDLRCRGNVQCECEQ